MAVKRYTPGAGLSLGIVHPAPFFRSVECNARLDEYQQNFGVYFHS
jgi:hypothetical protein